MTDRNERKKARVDVAYEVQTMWCDGGPAITHIVHTADWHLRGQPRDRRHTKEFNEVWQNFCAQIQEVPRDTSIHVVCGDIVHHFLSISPELVMEVRDKFQTLAKDRPTFVILGNHDMQVRALDRPDTLTAIFYGWSIPNLYFLRETGIYRFRNLFLCVWSLVDNGRVPAHACPIEPGMIRVALHHGSINGSRLTNGQELMNRTLRASEFDGYDIVCLGDIHKHQALGARQNIVYPGSLVCQDFGEVDSAHGYVVWRLNSDGVFTHQHHAVKNPYERRRHSVSLQTDCGIHFDPPLEAVPPPRGYYRLYYPSGHDEDMYVSAKQHVLEKASEAQVELCPRPREEAVAGAAAHNEFRSTNDMEAVMRDYIQDNPAVDGLTPGNIIDTFRACQKTCAFSDRPAGRWTVLRMTWKNLMAYGEQESVLNFESFQDCGIVGLLSANAQGKSSIVDIMCYILHGTPVRTTNDTSMLHAGAKSASGSIELISADRVTYRITRTLAQAARKGSRTPFSRSLTVEMLDEEEKQWKSINTSKQSELKARIESVVGNKETFVFLSVHLQSTEKPLWRRTAAELKNFFMDIFQFDDLEKVEKEAKQRCKHVENRLTRLISSRKDIMSPYTQGQTFVSMALELEACLAQERQAMEALQRDILAVQLQCKNIQIQIDWRLLSETTLEKLAATHEEVRERIEETCSADENIKALREQLGELKLLPRKCEIAASYKLHEEIRMSLLSRRYNEASMSEVARYSHLTLDGLTREISDQVCEKKVVLEKLDRCRDRLIEVQHAAMKWGPDRPPSHERPLTRPFTRPLAMCDTEATRSSEGIERDLLDERHVTMCDTEATRSSECIERDLLDERHVTMCDTEATRPSECIERDLLELKGRLGMLDAQITQDFNRDCEACSRRSHDLLQQELDMKADLTRLETEMHAALVDEWATYDKAMKETGVLDEERQKLEDERSELTACARLLDTDGLKQHANHVIDERLRELVNSAAVHEYENLCAEEMEERRLHEQIRDIEEMRLHKVQLEAQRDDLVQKMDRWRSSQTHRQQYERSRCRADSLDAEKSRLETRIHGIEAEVRQNRDNEHRCKAIDRDMVQVQQERLSYVAKLASKDGLGVFAMRSLLPEISADIQRMTKDWVDVNVKLQYHDENDKIELTWRRKTSDAVIAMHSGMEEFVVGLATKVAVSRCPGISRSNILIIDEGISVLDRARMAEMNKIIGLARSSGSVCLLITHVDAAQEHVDKTININIQQKGTGSRILAS